MGLLLPKKNARSGDRYQTDDVGLGNRVLNGSTSAVHLSFYSLFFLALDFFLSFCFDVPKFAESTSPFALLFGSVRFGSVWFGLVWFGLVWFGNVARPFPRRDFVFAPTIDRNWRRLCFSLFFGLCLALFPCLSTLTRVCVCVSV